MKKRVGNVEVARYGTLCNVTYHYNEAVNSSIELLSYEDLIDMEYALSRVKAAIDEERAANKAEGSRNA